MHNRKFEQTSIIEAIIFDFDGTLANTIDLSFDIYQDIAIKYRLNLLSRKKMLDLKELPAHEVFKVLGITKLKAPFVVAEGRRRLSQHMKSLEIDQHLAQLIQFMTHTTIPNWASCPATQKTTCNRF